MTKEFWLSKLMNLIKSTHDSWNKNYENNEIDLRLKYNNIFLRITGI